MDINLHTATQDTKVSCRSIGKDSFVLDFVADGIVLNIFGDAIKMAVIAEQCYVALRAEHERLNHEAEKYGTLLESSL